MSLELLQTGTYNGEDFILSIERSWSTDHSLSLIGWILSRSGPLDGMEICVDDICVPITNWLPRPDVLLDHPEYKGSEHVDENCGFIVQIPRLVQHQVIFNVKTQAGVISKNLSFKGSQPIIHQGFSEGSQLFNEFIEYVNQNRLRVLEIGSRIVSPGSFSKRSLFSSEVSYTGFDYYPDDNTDVVRDAHRLSSYFNGRRFDAIFSMSVFEHLAMPWLVAKEINQLLEVGGVTFHGTHNAWPIHEQPWDFWRFSDEALKVLFSPPMGFEVIKAGYFEPASIYLDQLPPGAEILPTVAAFGGVAILARKAADIDQKRFDWQVSVEELLGETSKYPQPNQEAQIQRIDEQPIQLSRTQPSEETAVVSPPPAQKSQKATQRLRKKIRQLEAQIQKHEAEIAAMQSSKFWKLRAGWFKLKKAIGIRDT